MSRLQPYSRLQRREGAGDVTRPPPRGAEVVLGIEELRVDLRRARKLAELQEMLGRLESSLSELEVVDGGSAGAANLHDDG